MKSVLIRITLLLLLLPTSAFGFKETAFGKLDLSATLSGEYDSRVFGISSTAYTASKNSNSGLIASDEIKSEDDFIVRFTPVLTLSKKLGWFTLKGSGGIQLAQYVKNQDKSYVIPVTTLTVDFDESLQKRLSTNAKIRFSATFDLGQHIDTSVLEQDLVSYTYFNIGLNARYNHSPKFAVGVGTSYSLRDYQTGSVSERPYRDFHSIPINVTAFYIYSEKLDFYTQYGYSATTSRKQNSSPNLIDSKSHSVSFGANGDLTPKLSGNAQIGYTIVNYDNPTNRNQKNMTMGLGLDWVFNTKTSAGIDVDRSFSPSPQGFSMFSTMSRLRLNHRLMQDLTAIGYVSVGVVDYTYANIPKIASRDSSSLNQYGFGFEITKNINQNFTAGGGYDYSYSDRDQDSFGRHLIRAQIVGRF
ncbi:MAG TPA: hypothetical protein DCG39_05940 [Opitutae bacterium]|nr:hypothetical protein [Opitutae bacterium]